MRSTGPQKRMGGKWGDEFRDRLRSLVTEDTTSKTQREFAKRVGVAETLAGGWLKTKGGRLPGAESLRQILAAFPTVSADWLLLGVGEKYRGQAREYAFLENEFKVYLNSRIKASSQVEPWVWPTLDESMRDLDLSARLVELITADMAKIARWIDRKHESAEAIWQLDAKKHTRAIKVLEDVFREDRPRDLQILLTSGAITLSTPPNHDVTPDAQKRKKLRAT